MHISAKWNFRRLLFEKFLRGHVWTVPGNMHVKFEVRSFNRFKPVWLTDLLRKDTQKHTHVERKQYLRYSLRSLVEKTRKSNSTRYIEYCMCLPVQWRFQHVIPPWAWSRSRSLQSWFYSHSWSWKFVADLAAFISFLCSMVLLFSVFFQFQVSKLYSSSVIF